VRTERTAISPHATSAETVGQYDLPARNYYSHTHLDWHDTEQWLDNEVAPIRLAWQHNRLVGALATSVPSTNLLGAAGGSLITAMLQPVLDASGTICVRIACSAFTKPHGYATPTEYVSGICFYRRDRHLAARESEHAPDMKPADGTIRLRAPKTSR
jgi:hypothetical protein